MNPFTCPFSQPSEPEWWVQDASGTFGNGMSWRNAFERPIEEVSRLLFADGMEIAAHDTRKVYKFREMEAPAMRV